MYIGDWMERGERYFAGRAGRGRRGQGPGRALHVPPAQRPREPAGRASCARPPAWAAATGSRILAGNGVEFLDAFFACASSARSSCRSTGAPTRARARERDRADHAPKALIYGDDFRDTAAALLGAERDGARIIGHVLALGAPDLPGAVAYGDVVRDEPAPPVTNERSPRRTSSACSSPAAPPALPRRRRSRTA